MKNTIDVVLFFIIGVSILILDRNIDKLSSEVEAYKNTTCQHIQKDSKRPK